MTVSANITGLYVGTVQTLWSKKTPSGIAKKLTLETLQLGSHGFERDQQADLKVHGGPDKALHHYNSDHYAYWKSELPHIAECLIPGGFGENISTSGISERDLCIGDILSFGSAKIQVSQGRQPCWKLNMHTGEKLMASKFQKTGYTGWYYRVLETGKVTVGDTINLLERPNPEWPLDTVIAARFNPRLAPETAIDLSKVPDLAEGWQKAFAKKSDASFIENTDARLNG